MKRVVFINVITIMLSFLMMSCSDGVKKDGVLLKGVFKVSDTKSVRFSQGNLQYNAGTGKKHKTATGEASGTWRFAENQWDVVGESNAYASADYDGWIDLFGWGTCGWSDSGAEAYQPWSISEKNEAYYDGINLSGADWGVYNAISNGGNEPGMWRTLTREEWRYLLRNNKWTIGTVEGMLCFMLIPSDLPSQSNITLIKQDYFSIEDYASNKYTAEEFRNLECLGVVALPCGGYRKGTAMYDVGTYGYYWSSSSYDSLNAYVFSFSSTYVGSDYYSYRYHGRSVRLVQDVQ